MGESFQQRHERFKREFLNQLDDIGWAVVTDYVNYTTPLTVECPSGHEQDIVPKRFYSTCPECNPPGSRPGPSRVDDHFRNNSSQGGHLGLYWHTET